MLNVLVTAVSVVAIFPVQLADPNNYVTLEAGYWTARGFGIHTLPLLTTIIETYVLNNSIIRLTDIWIAFIFSYAYLIWQYIWVT